MRTDVRYVHEWKAGQGKIMKERRNGNSGETTIQEETKKLVERIIGTGVSAITIHCRTRNMRKNERAVVERLREIVEFVDGLTDVVGRNVPIIANGDCISRQDAQRLKEVTGMHL